jgi:hypothetical protein
MLYCGFSQGRPRGVTMQFSMQMVAIVLVILAMIFTLVLQLIRRRDKYK